MVAGLSATSVCQVPITQQGTVTCTHGTLQLTDGTPAAATGTFQGSSGVVELDPAQGKVFTLGAGAKLLGGVNIDPSDSSGTVAVASGATALASGVNTFSHGTLGGPGTLQVPAGSTLRVLAYGGLLSGLTLNNQGSLTLLAASYLEVQKGTKITNSGTLDFNGDVTVDELDTTCSLVNTAAGTVTKDAGTGTASLNVRLNNQGLVTAGNGVLDITAPSAAPATGTFKSGSGTVQFDADSFILGSGAKISGGVTIASLSVGIAAGATVPFTGTNSLVNGTLAGPGTLQGRPDRPSTCTPTTTLSCPA